MATGGGGGGTTSGVGVPGQAVNSFQNSAVGDLNGMSLPAILNEVVSVTGVYPFPFATGPAELPTNPPVGVAPRPNGPVLVFGNSVTIGGTGGTATTGGGAGGGTGGGTAAGGTIISLLSAADFAIYSDRLLGSANRNSQTDYAAPAIDVPTFRRTFTSTTATTGVGTGAGGTGAGGTGGGSTTGGSTFTAGNQDPNDRNTDQDGGTSLSAGVVTGAFALVSSALTYWTNLDQTGVTSDAYLTNPVGVTTLNFGAHSFADLTAYNNPDGINAILQWTAVPANDPNDGLSSATPPNLIGSPNFRNYSRISVSNAIAAIEGTEALSYLQSHGDMPKIDSNNDGIITATELQNFVDDSTSEGLPEAGAMARLLGGTARVVGPVAYSNPGALPSPIAIPGQTLVGETPDQPDVLQRRFNFFDYVADGNLNGSVTLAQFQALSSNLLPAPDAFVINDRQHASADGYLVDPTAQRDYANLQHLLPKYEWVPKAALAKYRNVSPAVFHVNRGTKPGTTYPVYTLFDAPQSSNPNAVSNANLASNAGSSTPAQVINVGTKSPAGVTSTTATPQTPVATTTPTTTGTATASPATGTSTTNTGTAATTNGDAAFLSGLAAIANAQDSGATPTSTTSSSSSNQNTGTSAPTGSTMTTAAALATLPKMPVVTVPTSNPTPPATTTVPTTTTTATTTTTTTPKKKAAPKQKSFLQQLFG